MAADNDPNPLGDAPVSSEPPDATLYASPPEEGYEPHPLFPLEHDGRDARDIQFISFRRRRSSDGRIENLPEDIPANEIRSWAEVFSAWGGGEYKAIAKNRHHRVIAYSPQNPGEWMPIDTDSKPFTPRSTTRYRTSQPVPVPPVPAAPPAPIATPTPPPVPAAPPASAPASPVDLAVMELLRERSERARPPQPTSDPVLVELLHELRAQRSATNESAMTEMVKALTLALVQQRQEPRTKVEPTTVAVDLLKAMRDLTPQAPPQPSVTDRLAEYRQIRDLTTPAAPAAPLSEFGELKDLFASVMQADMMTKGTREPPAPPPPPPPAIERRQTPRRPLVHVRGVGLVDIVEPEPPPRIPAPELDLDALLSDPVQRALVMKRLLAEERLGAAPRGPQPAEPAVPVPSTAAPKPIAAVPAPPTTPEPAVPTPPAAPPTPEPIAAVPALPTASPEPIAAMPKPPAARSRPITHEDCERAVHSLRTFSRMPPDLQRAELAKIPGMGSQSDEIMTAMNALPPEAWPEVVAHLPSEVVRVLLDGPGGGP